MVATKPARDAGAPWPLRAELLEELYVRLGLLAFHIGLLGGFGTLAASVRAARRRLVEPVNNFEQVGGERRGVDDETQRDPCARREVPIGAAGVGDSHARIALTH